MQEMEKVLQLFPEKIRAVLADGRLRYEALQEIRLRADQPLMICYEGQSVILKEKGYAYRVSEREIRETMERIGRHSLYAYEDELRQGFLTIRGGHRVGVAGKTVLEKETVRSMKYISFVNVRLAHQIRGCADPVIPRIYGKDGQILHTLIISPPRCGKTTLLRDLIRQISDGAPGVHQGFTVGVVDERSEIAGCFQGVPVNDLGMRTDVLDGCPKAEGMMMLIRAMSPDVVAVDEIGSPEEIGAIHEVLHCGCKLLATVHGSSLEDVIQKPFLRELVGEHLFERFVILGGNRAGEKAVGRIVNILDGQGGVVDSC